MNSFATKRSIYIGIGFAVLASLIWAGNFIAARGVYKLIPPVSLAFYRWLCASLVIFPFTYKKFRAEWTVIKKAIPYLFWVALSGVTLFNTFVYIGAHYTSAINLALIGTTSSPVIAVILARIFLKEKIGWPKLLGIIFCITGILFLLSKGNFNNLLSLQFTRGDGWVLLAAFCFAAYTTLVRKKPASISAGSFLLGIFSLGTLLLFPFYLWEIFHAPPVVWNLNLVLVIGYLGIGASVICFLIWNIAIQRLGAGRTALFGNLIPIFSSLEAVIILHEKFSWIQVVSMLLVFAGILLANIRLSVKLTPS